MLASNSVTSTVALLLKAGPHRLIEYEIVTHRPACFRNVVRSLRAGTADRAWSIAGTRPMAGRAVFGCAVQAEPDAREDVAGFEGDD